MYNSLTPLPDINKVEPYKICMFTGSKWETYATVDPTINTATCTLPKISKAVHEMNIAMINKIMDTQTYFRNKEEYYHSYINHFIGTDHDEMEIVTLSPLRYMGCTTYPVIQYNKTTNIVRFLLYGTTEMFFPNSAVHIRLDKLTVELMNKFLLSELTNNLDKLSITPEFYKRLKNKDYVFFI